ncbi:MAG: rod shape-determining protein MreC [Candidatus Levyibacteriota bacterium]
MQKKGRFFYIFLILIFSSLFIFSLSKLGIFKGNFIASFFSPIQKEIHKSFISFTKIGSSSEKEQLKKENASLIKMLVDQKKLKDQNAALLDQFQTTYPKSLNLLAADVIGSPSFIPGVSVPETLIVNKGEEDGVKKGDVIIAEDNLVGKIEKTAKSSSLISLITSDTSIFSVKLGIDKNIFGVINGQGAGEMILDNVLLSESLKKDDIVLTKGDVDLEGKGYPPDLIVGKIISVYKNSSSLFQKADVISFLDFSKLTTVFIMIQR